MKFKSFPKPKLRKHRRAKNNPVPTVNDICIDCGKTFASTHEVFPGKNRQISIKYGFQIKACMEFHDYLEKHPKENKVYQQAAQRKFEETHTHEEFMAIIGKNYLD